MKDNKTSTERLEKDLMEISPFIKTTDSSQVNEGLGHWHTGEIVQSGRNGVKLEDLVHYTSLFDWFLFGEAASALLTAGSTFSMTARLRSGLEQSLDDYVVDAVWSNNQFVCKCTPSFPDYHIGNVLKYRRLRADN